MDATMLAGLPVTVAGGIGAMFLMANGLAVLGAILLGVAILATMFLVGQGMPRPDVVPRPGEEDQY